jgi:amino acid transporter
MIDLVPVLATVVVIATLATLILGLLSYVAFRARERRRPDARPDDPVAQRRFLVRLTLPEEPAGGSPAT